MSLAASRQQLGASCSGAAYASQASCIIRPALRHRRIGRAHDVIVCASSGSSGSTESFARDAKEAASRAFKKAKGRWDAFAKEQRLEQRANEAFNKASESAREATDKAKEKARRVFVELDSEYELTSKSARAVRRAEEMARDIDQTYGVRRRIRAASDYIARSWPTWQRQLDEFSSTWYGKTTVFVALCLLLSTPLFWAVLNVLLLLWWLCVPVAVLLLNYAREQQAQRLQQQREAEEEAARRAANPFADLFGGTSTRRRRGATYGRRNSYTQQSGPVIDAEWTTINEAEEPDRKSRGRRM
ncbi:hypothetical protein VOLCADRAFT_97368 [Volvox carteri f. nagariensis]|uniref:Uncharacterized protein n=1 Tax=Volvox carteri f. nagariensis TaxID=3068 RepID=D8UCK3_VOLCA|nr:uncharacterized protein VOLCADRAFT_97368 [Volvox carteri f. nagariensis]EFJ42507.1 hypothetical protein VOLCADRAFT_97368 [Volvox carteri f. nagariensis]|eukprot:XP_002956363.1 hypothetical protein VOLCADRAFT_97368 [Volvox carteri f. nagariensis]